MSILGAFLQSHPLTVAIVCDVFGMNLSPGGMDPVQWYSLLSILFCSGWFIFAIEVGIFKGTQSCPWAYTPAYHISRSTLRFPPTLPKFDKCLHVFLWERMSKKKWYTERNGSVPSDLRFTSFGSVQNPDWEEPYRRFETIGLLYALKYHVQSISGPKVLISQEIELELRKGGKESSGKWSIIIHPAQYTFYLSVSNVQDVTGCGLLGKAAGVMWLIHIITAAPRQENFPLITPPAEQVFRVTWREDIWTLKLEDIHLLHGPVLGWQIFFSCANR